jgi:hypothetical protein
MVVCNFLFRRDVDKVEEINMDMQEQLEMANEIQEALAAKLPGGYDLDDEVINPLFIVAVMSNSWM